MAAAPLKDHWPHDDTASLKRFYGDPSGSHGLASPEWQAHNLVHVSFPWTARLSWDKRKAIGSCLFHAKAADPLRVVFAEIWSHAGKDQHAIESAGLDLFGGTFNYRLKRGLNSLSVHAFGAAIDFDPERNPLGAKHGYMPKWVAEIFEAHGAVWGGHFQTRPDPMHFQFASI